MRPDLSIRGLSVRLAALMTLALFPIGAIALWQTREVVEGTESLARAAVLAETERATAVERRLLERARGATEGLAGAILAGHMDTVECSAMMREFIASQPQFAFAGFIDAGGLMACTSNGAVVDFSDSEAFQRARDRRETVFEVNPAGAATGESVEIVSTPVIENGRLLGFVSISLPHRITVALAAGTDAGIDVEYLTVNRDWRVLSSTVGLDRAADLLPADVALSDLPDRIDRTFTGRDAAGRSRLYAVSEMIPGQVVVLGSWPVDAEFSGAVVNNPVALTLAFPVLMWFAGISVALFGLHRLVIRHIYALRGAMRRFARGERSIASPFLEDPPAEFEVLETSFNRMVRILTAAEAQRERDLHDKTVLLREVHHRVKNNLQLIASIMNMHRRTAQTPEARRLLSQLQQRVRGLSTVHQTLNDTTDMTTVNSRALLEELMTGLIPAREVDGQSVAVDAGFEAVALNQDQAITLSMIAAEAITNATKYVGRPEGGRPRITVSFDVTGGDRARFRIGNTKGVRGADPDEDFAGAGAGGGIGRRLMQGLVRQIDGTETLSETETDYTYEVCFPLSELDATVPPRDLPRTDGAGPRPDGGAAAGEPAGGTPVPEPGDGTTDDRPRRSA